VAQEFVKGGYPKVFALKGGWNAWQEAHFPTEKKEPA
jgi:3-mercaptopyruvate sulfurtransferase SseA